MSNSTCKDIQQPTKVRLFYSKEEEAAIAGKTPEEAEIILQQLEEKKLKEKAANQPVVMEDIRDLLSEQIRIEYLIHGTIEANTTGALIGESTSGKSFCGVDISCCVSTATEWNGRNIDKPGLVVYFAGEGRNGIIRRVKAWLKKRGIKIPEGRFFLPRCRVSFDEAGARLIAIELEKLPEKPVLIIIDTVARFLPPGADENSAKEMMAFLNVIDSVRDQFGCVVCLVHHTGHSQDAQNRARGSSSFRAAMDWEIVLSKAKKRIIWTKMKDAEIPSPISYEIVKVDDSAVIQYSEVSRGSAEDYLTKGELLGLDTLKIVCLHSPNDTAHLEKWREEFYRKHTGDNANSKRSAFNRARTGLVNKRFISVDNDIYKLIGASVAKRFNATPATDDDRCERCSSLETAPNATHPSSDYESVPYDEEEGLFQ